MTNCIKCGRWGIPNGEFRGTYLFQTDEGPICESCLEEGIEEQATNVKIEQCKLAKMIIDLGILKEKARSEM